MQHSQQTKGVVQRGNRWQIQATYAGKNRYLGSYKTRRAAIIAQQASVNFLKYPEARPEIIDMLVLPTTLEKLIALRAQQQ